LKPIQAHSWADGSLIRSCSKTSNPGKGCIFLYISSKNRVKLEKKKEGMERIEIGID
jgi:hypothetical protein